MPRIGQHGLHCAQSHLGKFAQSAVIESVKLPIDIETMKNGQTERDCRVRGQRDDGFLVISTGKQTLQLRITGEVLDSERNAFDHCGDRILVVGNVIYDLVDEPVDGTHCAGDEQRVGIGKVAVHRLAGDTKSARDVGKAYPGPTLGNLLVYRSQDA